MDFILELAKLVKKSPRHHLPMQDCENCPYNSFLYKSKDCYLCYSSSFLESCYYLDISSHNKDCAYLYDEIFELKDCYDCTHVYGSELCYNLMSAYRCYNVDCSWWMTNCRDCMYCMCNQDRNNCFGCIYVQHKQYCILNQQYSKEEYFKKVTEIKSDLKKKGLHGKYLVMDAVELTKAL